MMFMTRSRSTRRMPLGSVPVLLAMTASMAGAQFAGLTERTDPREGLEPGLADAGVAMSGMELVAQLSRPGEMTNTRNAFDNDYGNTDLAFAGDYVIQGNYNGFMIWDVSRPESPSLRSTVVCPGGQADVSVHGDLLFVSVEEPRARVDCGTRGVSAVASRERFLGVRIFDISNLDAPRQVAAVQTCRGSHTHTLVPDPRDPSVMYIYNSGAARPRPPLELPGCAISPVDPHTSYFRIDVIRVPLDAPERASIVNSPAIFADPETGALAGLWPGGAHGPESQISSQTNHCHDITAYPELGIAAGACAGNGILLDIRDPVNPVRIEAVVDPNFAYWHSATFSNDASKVVFTDEWGGGRGARCQAGDYREWGANAVFTKRDGRLQQQSYYKLPAVQTELENCVAHNGSLIPVPGRDIMVQAWYQGGISVFDFTDPTAPFEIAFFDRGPVHERVRVLGGHWSAYWYNGRIYGSEIVRGLDVLRLTPNEHLSANEIAAAELVRSAAFNPQTQERIEWPASFAVSRAYVDQLRRNSGVSGAWLARVAAALDAAERLSGAARSNALAALSTQLERDAARSADPARVRSLAESLRKLAGAASG
jgi:hypothetical protein